MQHNSQISSPDSRTVGVRTPKSKSKFQTNTLYPRQKFETSEVGLQAVYIWFVLGCILVLGMLPYSFIHYKHVKSEQMTSITTSLKKSANLP
jgi:hypothetical protein